MAEARSYHAADYLSGTTCRNYPNCIVGNDHCSHSHEMLHQSLLRLGICRYLLQGRCRYGDSCWHDHNLPPTRNGRIMPFEDRYSAVPPSRYMAFAGYRANHSHSASSWANAPEFVPLQMQNQSYADRLRKNCSRGGHHFENVELCASYIEGECFEVSCPFVHGEECELCGKFCMHPFNDKQRKEHRELCEAEIEKDMELSFAVQRSQDKTCGICMDVIMEKEPISERRFGILEKCNHIFCLSCIRKWRRQKQLESNHDSIDNCLDPTVTRACPECRTPSDFITPSQYWVDTEEEKIKLISEYKVALSKKPCKYFKQGRGNCPFGGACFYLHAKPDGTKVILPPPVRRRLQNHEAELDIMGHIYLWDFLEFRDSREVWMHIDLEDDFLFSDLSSNSSDDSDSYLHFSHAY